MKPLTPPIMAQPGRNSWKLRQWGSAQSFWLQEGVTGKTEATRPTPATSNPGVVPHTGVVPQNRVKRAIKGIPTPLGNMGHLPQPRQNCPTETLGVPVEQVRENKACASAPPTGIRKTSTYQPANQWTVNHLKNVLFFHSHKRPGREILHQVQ